MQLDGYTPVDVTPWETASGGKAIACDRASGCAASLSFTGSSGVYTVTMQYYDQNSGIAHFRLYVNQQLTDQWASDNNLPSSKMDGHTATRHTTKSVTLKPGDSIHIEGTPDRGDTAGVDYLEITEHR